MAGVKETESWRDGMLSPAGHPSQDQVITTSSISASFLLLMPSSGGQMVSARLISHINFLK